MLIALFVYKYFNGYFLNCFFVFYLKGTSVLSPVIPFSLVVVPAFIIYRKSVQHVYEYHPALYIMSFGMVAAKVTNRLVVS